MTDDREEHQGDDMAELIARHLDETLPRQMLDSRLTAEGMLLFLGKLVEFWEKNGPMTVEKGAAFMFFIEQMRIDKTSEASARVMLELLAGARKAQAAMRRGNAS